jgi:hypothetical protein
MVSEKYRSKVIEFYTGSEEEAQKIRDVARSNGYTISKFVRNAILPYIYKVNETPSPSRLVEESTQLREENRRLREEGRAKDLLLERYESELRKTRDAAFLAPHGEAPLDPELLRILHKGAIHEYRLLEAMNIEENDSVAIRSISRQLGLLESSGLIAKGPNGWRWLP